MSRRVGSRALAVGSFAVAVAAGTVVVMSALGGPTRATPQADAAAPPLAARSVAFGHARVILQPRPGGLLCFRVARGGSTLARSCTAHLAADEIGYARAKRAVGGVAGSDVAGVIVRLTRKGTVWATMRRGTFYADVPAAHRVRALVKVLRSGARTTFTVT